MIVDRQATNVFREDLCEDGDSRAQEAAFETLSLLLVEDDKLIRESLLEWLASVFLGSHLVGAASCEADLWRSVETPHVIVADIALSGRDGVDTVRRLSESFPAARIIALVKGGESQPWETLLDAGVCACLRIWEVHQELVPLVRWVLSDRGPARARGGERTASREVKKGQEASVRGVHRTST